MKRIGILIIGFCLLFSAFLFFNTREDPSEAENLTVETHALYEEPLIFEEIIQTEANAIVIGTVEAKGKSFISATIEEANFHSTPYTIKINQKFKGFNDTDLFQVNVLETVDPGLQVGDQVFLYVKETQPGYYVPLTPEYGLKLIENGRIIGQFLKEEHQNQSIELPDQSRALDVKTFVNEIKSTLSSQ